MMLLMLMMCSVIITITWYTFDTYAAVATTNLDFVQKTNTGEEVITQLYICRDQSTTLYLKNIQPVENSTAVYEWTETNGYLSIKVSADTKSAEIKAVAKGSTKIQVKDEKGATFILNVKVLVPATSILINSKQTPTDIVINKGASASTITASLTPTNTDDMLTWTTDKEDIIKVTQVGVSGPTQKILVAGLKAGEVNLTATSKSGLSNTVRIIVKVQDIGECQATIQEQTYTGEELRPLPTKVILNGKILTPGTDYEIIGYENNINAGTATIHLQGTGNYSGTAEVSFAINQKKIDSSVTVLYEEEHVYSNKGVCPPVIVKMDDIELVQGTDYTIQYPERSVELGTYRFTINFKGNLKGTVSKNYKIIAKSVEMLTIHNSKDEAVTTLANMTYTGSRLTQMFSVYDEDTKLTENKDYVVSYADNLNAGTASVTIKGKGNYDSATSKVIQFTIKPYSLKNVSITKISDMIYTGMKQEPNLVVRRKLNDSWKQLERENDYKVTYTDNVNTGKATVKITAGNNGNYSSSKTITFRILPSIVTGVIQKSASQQSVKLSWNKNEGGVSGYTIYKFENDKYTYVKSTTKDYVVISGLKPGSNYTYAVRAFKKVGNYVKYYSTAYSSFVTAMTASKTPSIQLSSADLTVKVNWIQSNGTTRYYVYYSVKGSKGPYKKAGYSGGTSYTINAGFKKGKTVYVKIRAARMIAGKEYLGSYSAAKKIKVK